MSFRIRSASPDDVRALAHLHVQTFNETHRGGRSGGRSFELREQQWREAFTVTDGSWFCFVVEDDDRALVAFAMGTPHDGGEPGFAGELNKIYALQRIQRQAIGRGCLFIMKGLPIQAWERFGWWLVIGLVLYFVYGFKHSKLRNS
jgi:C-terminus of AA_permease